MKPYGKGLYYINPELRKSFQNGVLSHQWRKDYPMLFDDEDLALAISQNSNHFYEWLGAIRIFEDKKYLCLVEKYQFKKHKVQRDLFHSIVPKEIYTFIDSPEYGGRQVPDLLAYSPDKTDWFFCEVKGWPDRMHEGSGQEIAFKRLEKNFNIVIQLLIFKPEKIFTK